jgi:hypothetical protein
LVGIVSQSNAIISNGLQEFGFVVDTHTTMFVVSNPFAAFQSFVLTGLLIFLKLGI